MQQIKEFLNFLDVIVGAFWSFTVMEMIPLVIYGQVIISPLSRVSDFVNLLLTIAGLVYLVVRIIHFIKMSKLNIEYKKQEIIEKKNFNLKIKQ